MAAPAKRPCEGRGVSLHPPGVGLVDGLTRRGEEADAQRYLLGLGDLVDTRQLDSRNSTWPTG